MKLCNTFFGLWLKPSNVKLPHFPLAPALQTLQTLKCVSEMQSQAHKSFAARLFEKKFAKLSHFAPPARLCSQLNRERKRLKSCLVWEGNLGKVDQSAARCCLSPHRAQKSGIAKHLEADKSTNWYRKYSGLYPPTFISQLKEMWFIHCTQTVSWFISSVVISWKKQNKANQFQKFLKAKLKSLWYKYFMQRLW